MRLTFLALTVLLALAACRPSFQARYGEVLPGDRRDRVIELLGEPKRTGWFSLDLYMMGPPEVLFGIVPPGTQIEELTWSDDGPDGEVVYQVYLDESGRLLAMTHYSEHDVF